MFATFSLAAAAAGVCVLDGPPVMALIETLALIDEGDQVDPLIGVEIPPFTIERRLGAGGMGTVYLAGDVGVQRKVAIKVMNWERGSENDLLRFMREAHALGRLQHQGVVQVFGAGTFNRGGVPTPYLVS